MHWKDNIKKYLILFCPVFIIFIRHILSCYGINSICLFKYITGHSCIGCGMTQAFMYILQGKFYSAFQQNHFVIIVFPVVLYCWLKYVYDNVIKNCK